MPEIPTYQSRNPGPVGSEGQLSNPHVVGGGEITQGFSNLSSGLLVYAHAQAQQDAIDQATLASKHITELTNQFDQAWADAQLAQMDKPIDPRDRLNEFNAFMKDRISERMNLPEVREQPAVAKYMSTHLPTLLSSRYQAAAKQTVGALKNYNEVNYQDQLTGFADNTINDPAHASEYEKQAKAFIQAGAYAGIDTTPAKTLADWRSNVSQQRGRAIVGAESQEFINAEVSGSLDKFWADRGMHLEHFPTEVQKSLSTFAHEQNTMRIANDTAERTESERRIKDYQMVFKNDFLSRHRDHQDVTTGQMMKAQPVDKILADLGTLNSKALLGSEWDSVNSYYIALKHHDESGEGKTPPPEKWNQVLEGIYTGRLDTPMKVLKESTGLGFSVQWRDTAIDKFNVERSQVDTATQQRVHQALDVIKGKFALPGGAAIDPAGALTHQNMVEQRFYLWLEGMKAQGGRVLQSADIIGTAQKIADDQFLGMQNNVINIIPQTEASLYYKTPAEVETAFKDHKITKHQADSFLQEIAQFERLQHIAETKPKAGGKGRGEAFK